MPTAGAAGALKGAGDETGKARTDQRPADAVLQPETRAVLRQHQVHRAVRAPQREGNSIDCGDGMHEPLPFRLHRTHRQRQIHHPQVCVRPTGAPGQPRADDQRRRLGLRRVPQAGHGTAEHRLPLLPSIHHDQAHPGADGKVGGGRAPGAAGPGRGGQAAQRGLPPAPPGRQRTGKGILARIHPGLRPGCPGRQAHQPHGDAVALQDVPGVLHPLHQQAGVPDLRTAPHEIVRFAGRLHRGPRLGAHLEGHLGKPQVHRDDVQVRFAICGEP